MGCFHWVKFFCFHSRCNSSENPQTSYFGHLMQWSEQYFFVSLLLDLFHTLEPSKFRYLVLYVFITYKTVHVASPKIHLSLTTFTVLSKISFVVVYNAQNN